MNFSPQSKVWIYQSSRQFTSTEVEEIQKQLDEFTAQWTAHGHQLKAKAEIPYGFFIVLIVDQELATSTGCSIDSSARVIKKIDVLMLGPQVKYMKKQFEDKVAGTDTKMDVINMQDYGMMNGEKVLKTALTLMGL